MTMIVENKQSSSDSELVAASRNGNREAFGQIVRRYQGMISGLVYASCGDLHRSEDIAQETFLCAWKSLSGLRDPAKLAGWLCQIARHRIADHFREPSTQKVRLVQETIEQPAPESADPPDQAMRDEESQLLWRTLAQIPQPYRETMVLYYRQGQSTAEVAAAMETTDAGVRQRLSRGRQMLREELAAMLERNLVKSAPGEHFSLAVVAALPMAASQTAALAVAKGTAAKGSGAMMIVSLWVAPILAFVSMALITIQSITQTKGRGRWLVVGYWSAYWLILAGWVVGSLELTAYGQRQHWDYATFVPVLSLGWCGFAGLFFTLMTVAVRKGRRAGFTDHRHRTLGSFWLRVIFLAPLVYLGVSWTIFYALRAGDTLSAEVIAIAALLASVICAARASEEHLRHNPIKMAFESWVAMIVIIVIAVNWRMRPWLAEIHHQSIASLNLPLWSMNVLAALLLVWICLLRFSGASMTRRQAGA